MTCILIEILSREQALAACQVLWLMSKQKPNSAVTGRTTFT